MKSGFIYIWRDSKRNLYYIGSHLGSETDGYIGSNKILKCKYKSRPETFKRRIIERFDLISAKELLEKEQRWLSMIKDNELSGVRYYNEKKVAAGGDIFSSLTEDKKILFLEKSRLASRLYWDNISEEEMQLRRDNAFGGNTFDRSYIKEKVAPLLRKTAKIIYPDGKEEIIENIKEFANENLLNYGNLKSMLRGIRATCGGFRGSYI